MELTMCPTGEILTEIGCMPTEPIAFIGRFYGVGLSLIGGVSLLFIIMGGYLILTSRGNPDSKVLLPVSQRFVVCPAL